jgi:glycosyltransferase involved in cell wall biosynthesis/GT2 family glycosyltransferase
MNARPLRVAVVSPFGELGGAEIYLLRLLDATDRLDTHVLLLRDGPFRAELEGRGIPVTVLDVGRRGTDLVRAMPAVRAWLRRTDADVVVGNGVKGQAVVGPVAWATGVPNLWIKHDHSFDGLLTALLSRLAGHVVATAEEVAHAVPRRDVTVLVPPMPTVPALPVEAARERMTELAGPWPGRTVAMLTRLSPYKGVDTAVAALGLVPGSGWRLVVLGDDDPAAPHERVRLRDLAARHGVADRVHLVGYVPEAARLLPAVDAVAVLTRPLGPRTPSREGFGMAAAEAMRLGRPVIVPDDDGECAARARHGAGLLVDATDPGAVAKALMELDPGTAAAIGERARLAAASLPTAAETADRLVTLLTGLARRPGAGLASERPVSVVVPVLDEAAVVHDVLGPVAAQLGPDDELVVVDSGSRDDTRALVREAALLDPRVRLVEVAPCSIAASRNAGVREARYDDIACTDAGCRVDPGWLGAIRSALADSSRPDVVVGVYRAEARTAFQRALAGVAFPDPAELHRASVVRRAWLRTVGPQTGPMRGDGRSLAFTRTAWERGGGFREDLLTAEDEAFVRDAVASGARSVLLRDATVSWHQRDTARLAFRQFRGYGRGAAAGRSVGQARTDAVRAGGYVAAAGLAASGRRGRVLALVSAALVLAVPAARVAGRGHGPTALALLPAAQLVKDGGKLLGVAEALLLGRTGALRRPR